MITITINHNDDTITVINSDLPRTGKLNYTVKGSTFELKDFLVELLNIMDLSEVTLEEINEDVRRIVEEW